jgi:hypothetical protein
MTLAVGSFVGHKLRGAALIAVIGGALGQGSDLRAQSEKSSRTTRRANRPQARVATGTWGGDHMRLEVLESGARIEYDCARGEITGSLDLTRGRFDNAGTFLRTGSGPIVAGRNAEPRPARYQGSVTAKRMTVVVTLTDRSQQIGTFTLTQGHEGRLWKCR